MPARSTGYFAGFDLEDGEHVRRIIVGIEAVMRPSAFSPLLGDRQRTTIQLLAQAMSTSPLINTIIRTQLLPLSSFVPINKLVVVGRILDAYVVASAAMPGTAAYAEAERAWNTKDPLQPSASVLPSTPALRHPTFQPRGQIIDDDDDDYESEVEVHLPWWANNGRITSL